MDFTSDSTVPRQNTGSDLVSRSRSHSSSSSHGLNDNDLRLIHLQEQKDSLLSKRNSLLQEIDTYSIQLKSPTSVLPHEDADVDVDSLLMDLIQQLSSSRDDPTAQRAQVIAIDGNSDVQTELKSKYDTLPLLNMDLRLKYLSSCLYPHVILQTTISDDVTIMHATYNRIANSSFTIHIRLRYRENILLQCQLEYITNSVKWNLKPLTACHNPTSILLGCYEFDKIRSKRLAIFEAIMEALSPYTSVSVNTATSSLTLQRQGLHLKLQISFIIDFGDGSMNYLMFPNSVVTSQLFKSGKLVTDPVTNGIQNSLIEEYGISKGLIELCKACLCL